MRGVLLRVFSVKKRVGGLGGAAPLGRPVALTLGPPLNLPLGRGRGMARG